MLCIIPVQFNNNMDEFIDGVVRTSNEVGVMLRDSDTKFEDFMTSLQDDLQNIKTSINKPILKKEPAPCRRVTRATNRELNQISTNQNVQSSVDADVKQEYESSEPTPSAILLKGSMKKPVKPAVRIRRTCSSRMNSLTAEDAKAIPAAKMSPIRKMKTRAASGVKVDQQQNEPIRNMWDMDVTQHEWTKEPGLTLRLKSQQYLHAEHKNFMKNKKVDLAEIFSNICKSKLVRNSSVNWNSPQSISKTPEDLQNNQF